MDNSGDLSELESQNKTNYWHILTETIVQIISHLQIGENNYHFSLVTFNNSSTIELELDDYVKKSSIFKKIRNVQFVGGERNISAGLYTMLHIFDPKSIKYGDRWKIPNVGVFLTSRSSIMVQNNFTEVLEEVKKQGITMLSVGISDNINEAELSFISTYGKKGETYWRSSGENLDKEITKSVSDKLCQIGMSQVFV